MNDDQIRKEVDFILARFVIPSVADRYEAVIAITDWASTREAMARNEETRLGKKVRDLERDVVRAYSAGVQKALELTEERILSLETAQDIRVKRIREQEVEIARLKKACNQFSEAEILQKETWPSVYSCQNCDTVERQLKAQIAELKAETERCAEQYHGLCWYRKQLSE